MNFNKEVSQAGQGLAGNIQAKDFFNNNNVDGLVDATSFLDVVKPMSVSVKDKYASFWNRLRNGNHISGMLKSRTDKDGLDYAWVVIELPRGKEEYKVILFSDKMLQFLINYQSAIVSVRFTLNDLINEAERIENEGNEQAKGQ